MNPLMLMRMILSDFDIGLIRSRGKPTGTRLKQLNPGSP